MNLNVINSDNSSFGAKNDLNLYTSEKTVKNGKNCNSRYVLGDKKMHSNNNNVSYIFHVTVWTLHNQNMISWTTVQFDKAFLPFSGCSIVSREDVCVFLVSHGERHMHVQAETLVFFLKKKKKRNKTTTKTTPTPKTNKQKTKTNKQKTSVNFSMLPEAV